MFGFVLILLFMTSRRQTIAFSPSKMLHCHLSPISSTTTWEGFQMAVNPNSARDQLRFELLELCEKSEEDRKDHLFAMSFEKQIVEAVSKLVVLNPTSVPLSNWLFPKTPVPCSVDGNWQCRFSNDRSNNLRIGKRGYPELLFSINSTSGTFVRNIQFPSNKGSLKKISVYYQTKAISSTNLLCFRRNICNFQFERRWIFNRIYLPNPLFFLSPITEKRQPILKIEYLDDEVLIYRLPNDKLSILVRAYEAWDPMRGWTYINGV